MSYLIANIPAIPVWVKMSYLYDLKTEDGKIKGEGELTPGFWVTVKSKPKRALLFETLLTEYGALYDKLPIDAFVWKENYDIENQFPLSHLQLWDCFSYDISIITKDFIKKFPVDVVMKDKSVQKGEYLFTIDSCASDPNKIDCSLSEYNPEHKSFNIIKLDNGQFTAQPNNRVLWYDASLITNSKKPDFNVCTNDFVCEGRDKWNVATDNKFYYESKNDAEI